MRLTRSSTLRCWQTDLDGVLPTIMASLVAKWRDGRTYFYLVESARRTGATVRDLRWAQARDGERALGRVVTLRRPGDGREHPVTLKVVGPRLLMTFARAPEDVIVVYELGLVGLFAGLSKALRRGRSVVSLVEVTAMVALQCAEP